MDDQYNDRSERSPFIEGRRYHVLEKAPAWINPVPVGDVIVYSGAVYDPETRHTIFIFSGKRDQYTWALADDEPLEEWSAMFEITDAKWGRYAGPRLGS